MNFLEIETAPGAMRVWHLNAGSAQFAWRPTCVTHSHETLVHLVYAVQWPMRVKIHQQQTRHPLAGGELTGGELTSRSLAQPCRASWQVAR